MVVQIYALPQHGYGQQGGQHGGFGYQQPNIGAGNYGNQGHYPSQQHGFNDGHGQGHNQFGGGHGGGYDEHHGGGHGHGGHGGGHGHSHGHRYWFLYRMLT